VPQGTSGKPQGITYLSTLLSDVTEVRVGGKHACVRRQNHLPVCWGEYVSGELGNGDPDNYPDGDITEATKLQGLVTPSELTALALGDRHSCAKLTTGEVMCWGNNEQGQSGAPLTSALQLVPAKVEGATSVDTLIAGGARSCMLVSGEGAYCWGQGAFGELGIGENDVLPECPGFSRCTPAPVRVKDDDLGASIVEIATGYEFTCGRLSDERVACWGRNTFGQLGPKVVEGEAHLPVETLKQKTLQVATGGEHACAILEDHSVVCWGRNDTGQLGVPPGEMGMSAVAVTVPLPF
jgi:alpha-tubulin suppressor-like RCC1 family protein